MADHPAYAPPQKRSLTLRGHRSSVTLEPLFWDAFRALAAREGRALNALAAEIDAARPPEVGLASAIRTFVLSRAWQGAPGQSPGDDHAPAPAERTADRAGEA